MRNRETIAGIGLALLSGLAPTGYALMWPGSALPDWLVFGGIGAGVLLTLWGLFSDSLFRSKPKSEAGSRTAIVKGKRNVVNQGDIDGR